MTPAPTGLGGTVVTSDVALSGNQAGSAVSPPLERAFLRLFESEFGLASQHMRARGLCAAPLFCESAQAVLQLALPHPVRG
jgi:hypothetical protein